MNDEKFELILGAIQKTNDQVATLATLIGDLNKKFDRLEARVDNLDKKFDRLEARVDNLDKKVDRLEAKVDHMDSEFTLFKSQLEENTALTKAIYHLQEKSDSKIDGLVQQFAEYQEDMTSTKKMLGDHEISIRSLRRKPV